MDYIIYHCIVTKNGLRNYFQSSKELRDAALDKNTWQSSDNFYVVPPDQSFDHTAESIDYMHKASTFDPELAANIPFGNQL